MFFLRTTAQQFVGLLCKDTWLIDYLFIWYNRDPWTNIKS